MTTFDACFGIVVGFEGGYSDDPADPGGATKFGLSQRAYPDLDIATITLDFAKGVYRRDYWTPLRADELPPPIAFLAFDAAVNTGLDRSVRWLQAAAGAAVDGIVGPHTLAAVKASYAANPHTLAIEIVAQRTRFMGGLATWATFGLGWSRRLAALPYQSLNILQ